MNNPVSIAIMDAYGVMQQQIQATTSTTSGSLLAFITAAGSIAAAFRPATKRFLTRMALSPSLISDNEIGYSPGRASCQDRSWFKHQFRLTIGATHLDMGNRLGQDAPNPIPYGG